MESKLVKSIVLSSAIIGISSTTIIPLVTSCKFINSLEAYGLSEHQFSPFVSEDAGPLCKDAPTKLSGHFFKSVTDINMLKAMNEAMNIYSYTFVFCNFIYSWLQYVHTLFPQIQLLNISFKVEVINKKLTPNTKFTFDGIKEGQFGHFAFTVNGNQSLCAAGGGGARIEDNKIIFGQYGNEYKEAHNFHFTSTGFTNNQDN
jgi:hypothetical protein